MPANLLGPEPTYLPDDHPDVAARRAATSEITPSQVAAMFPAASWAWSVLARQNLDTDPVMAYAYARVGYHRGLDALRRAGWRGQGEVPADHVPNRGFLACLDLLGKAALAIGELDEAKRCQNFLADCGVDTSDAATRALLAN